MPLEAPVIRKTLALLQPPGLPACPQCFAGMPCTTTWMWSGEAPLDSASAFVSASMIFGTDSSVTRLS